MNDLIHPHPFAFNHHPLEAKMLESCFSRGLNTDDYSGQIQVYIKKYIECISIHQFMYN